MSCWIASVAEVPCRQDAGFRFELVRQGVLTAVRPMFALLARLRLLHCNRLHHRHYLPPPTLVCPPQTPSASLDLQNNHQSVITRLHLDAPSYFHILPGRIAFNSDKNFKTKFKLTLSTFLCSDSILIFPFPFKFCRPLYLLPLLLDLTC